MKLTRCLFLGRKSVTNLHSMLKSRDIPFFIKGLSSQSYGFSNSHVWVWELDYKESWAPKNWCFWTVVLEKTLESPLDCKDMKPVNPKENQSWIFVLKDWCWSWHSNTLTTWCEELTHLKRPWYWQRLKAGVGDNRGWDGWMASLTQWPEFEQAPWVGDGQGSLVCCKSMGSQRVRDEWVTELNWEWPRPSEQDPVPPSSIRKLP